MNSRESLQLQLLRYAVDKNVKRCTRHDVNEQSRELLISPLLRKERGENGEVSGGGI